MGTARTKSVTVRLDVDVNRRLDRYCKEDALSKSLVVNCALDHLLRAKERARQDIIRDYVVQAKKKR
jgi:predicted transcriptional regulator